MNEEEKIPGVVSGSNSKTYYWSIYSGNLARKVDEGFRDAKMRTNKNNVKVWEQHERAVKGMLRDVNVYENTFDGKKIVQLVIKLVPQPGYLHVINIPKESRYYGSFLEKLPLINLKEEIEIAPYSMVDEKTKKTNSGITVRQNNNKFASYYKKKVGDKWEYLYGFPSFPADWNGLNQREKDNYFYDVDDFFTAKLAEWRAANAPDYQTEKEERFDSPKTDAPKSGKANAVTDEELAAGGIGDRDSSLPF